MESDNNIVATKILRLYSTNYTVKFSALRSFRVIICVSLSRPVYIQLGTFIST